MIAVQVMANDVAVGFGGAGGYLEMNVYKPLIIFNVTHSVTMLARVARPADMVAFIREHVYKPEYKTKATRVGAGA